MPSSVFDKFVFVKLFRALHKHSATAPRPPFFDAHESLCDVYCVYLFGTNFEDIHAMRNSNKSNPDGLSKNPKLRNLDFLQFGGGGENVSVHPLSTRGTIGLGLCGPNIFLFL